MSEHNLNWNYEDLVKHALTGGCVSCGNNSGRRRFYDNHPRFRDAYFEGFDGKDGQTAIEVCTRDMTDRGFTLYPKDLQICERKFRLYTSDSGEAVADYVLAEDLHGFVIISKTNDPEHVFGKSCTPDELFNAIMQYSNHAGLLKSMFSLVLHDGFYWDVEKGWTYDALYDLVASGKYFEVIRASKEWHTQEGINISHVGTQDAIDIYDDYYHSMRYYRYPETVNLCGHEFYLYFSEETRSSYADFFSVRLVEDLGRYAIGSWDDYFEILKKKYPTEKSYYESLIENPVENLQTFFGPYNKYCNTEVTEMKAF